MTSFSIYSPTNVAEKIVVYSGEQSNFFVQPLPALKTHASNQFKGYIRSKHQRISTSCPHVRSALYSSCSVFKLSAPQSWWSPGGWYSPGSLGTDSRGPQVQAAPAGTAWVVTPPCGHLCRCGNLNDTHYPARINHRHADWLTGVEALEFICTSWKALHNYAFNHTKYLSVGSKLMFPDSTHIRLQTNKQVKLNGCFHLQFSVGGACDVE